MPLKEYKKKRSFRSSPEPRGSDSASGSEQLRFVVQKHHASHLHYDFRLELDRVLVSWAVPKGPSLNPEEKRLAMMTEDHPLDYLTFQGTIPKGNYGAGTVEIWDAGVYHSPHTLDARKNRKAIKYGLKKGHLEILLAGVRLKGLFSLVKLRNETHDKSWLLIKHEDAYAKNEPPAAKGKRRASKKQIPMPRRVRPMLAALVNEPFDRQDWLFEMKWDGYRAIAHVRPKKIDLYSRKGNSFVKKYPSIVHALSKTKHRVIFDGEVIALKNHRPDFHTLQNLEETKAPLRYVIFDLLYLDGQDLRDQPLMERKRLLKRIFPRHPDLVYSEHVEENGRAFFEQATTQMFEGIIGKKSDSPYREGVRSDEWLKIKRSFEQEAIIAGFTEPRGTRKRFGALVLGAYDHGELRYIGHSGGGFTDKELAELHRRLKRLAVKKSPFRETVPLNSPITWVKPKLICHIRFTEWTPDNRMRHPIYAGLREDKRPEEVLREYPAKTSALIKRSEQLKFTNTEKIFWPKEKYMKGDVIAYYERMSDIILPYLIDRPESLHRHPNGIKKPSFFQKDITGTLPSFVETATIWSESNKKNMRYLLCQNKETLLYMANLGCIELNPWNSRIDSLDRPDYMIIDLDPADNTWGEVLQVALVTHELLEEACEKHYVKTSGKTGLHILIPLGGKYDYEDIRRFSQILANIVHKKIPELTSVERSPAKRKKKIYIDYLQNRRGQTIAAPYSLRPWPGATVSTPVTWQEIKKGITPDMFTLKTIKRRLSKKGDILKPMLSESVDLKESIQCLKRHLEI